MVSLNKIQDHMKSVCVPNSWEHLAAVGREKDMLKRSVPWPVLKISYWSQIWENSKCNVSGSYFSSVASLVLPEESELEKKKNLSLALMFSPLIPSALSPCEDCFLEASGVHWVMFPTLYLTTQYLTHRPLINTYGMNFETLTRRLWCQKK